MSYTEAEFRESVQRYLDMPAGSRPQWNYQAGTPAVSRAMVKYLGAQLTKHKGSTVQFHQGVDAEGLVVLWYAVVDKDGTLLGAGNDLFPCPPRCS